MSARPARVVVIGGGALGCLYAAALAAIGVDTWILDHRQATVDALRESGIIVEGGSVARHVAVQATTDPASVPPADLAIVLVKTPALGAAARAAAAVLSDSGFALALQNGFDHGERLAQHVPRHQVLHGVTYVGAERLGPGHILPNLNGPTVFGSLERGRHESLEPVRALLMAADLAAHITDDPRHALWTKSVVASALNGACALLRCRLGGLDTDAGRTIVSDLLEEAFQLAAAEGVELNAAEIYAGALQLLRERPEGIPSMLQDVLAGRETEIESLSGYLARRADVHGVAAPLHTSVTALIRGLEQSYDYGSAATIA